MVSELKFAYVHLKIILKSRILVDDLTRKYCLECCIFQMPLKGRGRGRGTGTLTVAK